MKALHKSCLSSNIIEKYFKPSGMILFCKHCGYFLETSDIINIDTPFADCISIIKLRKGQEQIAEMVINAIGKVGK